MATCDTHGPVSCPRCAAKARHVGHDGPTARLRAALRRGTRDRAKLVLAVYGEDTPASRRRLSNLMRPGVV